MRIHNTIKIGRLELMWAKWTCPFFSAGYVAGGWLRCWYIGRLRIAWRLNQPRVDKWNSQPSYVQTTVVEVVERPAFCISEDE